MKTDYDLAIIGSGFGGSLLALIARRLGLSVLLLEKGSHPRFAIGESTSPLANLLLEQMAVRYDLPRMLPLTSYGLWQRTYPEVGCGLKRGFTFYHHAAGQPFANAPNRTDQLLVAASPSDHVADTHWLRADVDEFLMKEAVAAGAEYYDQVRLDAPEWPSEGGARLTGEWSGQAFSARARLVVDATGPRGFLSRALSLPDAAFADYPATQSLYTHFTGVARCDRLTDFGNCDSPPYPPDAAAVHHVFDGGWMWVLRFDSGITSAGVALTEALADDFQLSEGRTGLAAFAPAVSLDRGAVCWRAADSALFLCSASALSNSPSRWPRLAMLPSAAAFVDPLFSTGIPLTLLGLERLGRILEASWGRTDLGECLAEYADITLQEADATADFIGGCYAAMPNFPVFASLSMFYFAAASFSEMARRLDRPHLAPRFLASGHAEFGPALRHAAAWTRQGAGQASSADVLDFEAQTASAIECLNVAGLCDPRKRHWYRVDLEDVVTSAEKLGMTSAEMRAVLQTASWAQE